MISFFYAFVLSIVLTSKAATKVEQSEVDTFIDLCDLFSTTMTHCAAGWAGLEDEIMESIASFSDRILLTESLIGEEADEILEMASRIVTTEEMVTDMLDKCDCNRNITLSTTLASLQNVSHDGDAKIIRKSLAPTAVENSKGFGSPLARGIGNSSVSGLYVDRCKPMDEMIDVMEEALRAFETFNDDFLEVLGYMDEAIGLMGDRIVSTECLIMNMSMLIGDMADKIVQVESLMLDATEHCCQSIPGAEMPSSLRKLAGEDKWDSDDIVIRDCDAFLLSSSMRWAKQESPHSLLVKARTTLETAFHSFQSRKFNDMTGGADSSAFDGPMPCSTWWNPFCCAAEICADMMVAMMRGLEGGADAMKEMMIGMVDEIGVLADDIVTTEEDIVQMGERILSMSDMVVEFVDDGIQFAEEFCPGVDGHVRPSFARTPVSIWQGMSRPPHAENLPIFSHNKTRLASTLHGARTKFSSAIMFFASVDSYVKTWTVGRGSPGLVLDGPMPTDFDDMIHAMASCARVAETMLTEQMKEMTSLMSSLNNFDSEYDGFMKKVGSLDSDISTLSQDFDDASNSMDELAECS